MNKKIAFGLLIASVAVLSLIGYALFESSRLNENYARLALSARVDSQIREVESEVYHTQLELWEYAYIPRRERLSAFEDHLKTLSEKLDKIISLTSFESTSLYSDALADIAVIVEDINKIQNDWQAVLAVLEPIMVGNENGKSVAELTPLYIDSRTRFLESEQLFDSLSLNDKIAHFVQKQHEHVLGVAEEMRVIKDTINIILLVLAGAYMVLLFLIALWLNALIAKIQRETER